jgi:DNA-binding beta-propeller fold protein YncE
VNEETRESGTRPGAGEIVAGGTFAGHRIVAELGRGGMGIVYRVHDPALARDRAMKVIAPALSADPGFRERFRRESRLAAQVEHPNVIPIYRAGEENRQLFLVMRLVAGPDLRTIVAAEGPLDPARVARIVGGVASALDAAHEQGLVHRDVKPANVLVETADSRERVYVCDFGISRSESGGTITDSGAVMGSLDYVAPEQLEGGTVDRRADVYSLACVAYFALTGEPPYPRDSDVAKMYAHVHAPRPRPSRLVPAIGPAVDETIARALAVDPGRRPQTAGEFAALLQDSLIGGDEAATVRLPRRSAAGPRRRRFPGSPSARLVWAGIAAAIAAAAIVIAILARGGGSGVAPPRVVATTRVGDGANGIAVGPRAVWVAVRSGNVVEIDRRTNRRVGAPIHVGGAPSAVASAFGSVWVTDAASGTLIRIEHGRVRQRIPVGSRPADVVAADGFVWVASEGADVVTRIDPFASPPEVTGQVAVSGGPHALAIGDRAVWAAGVRAGTVSEVDPRAVKLAGRPIPAGTEPTDIAVGPGAVWVIDNPAKSLLRIDPRTRAVTARTAVGPRPRALKQGLGYLWVANGGSSTVWRLDQTTGERIGRQIKVGRDPADITVGDGSVWTANYAAGTVTRIKP